MRGCRVFQAPWTTRIGRSRQAFMRPKGRKPVGSQPLTATTPANRSGKAQAEAVGDGRTFATTHQEDPFRMNVQQAAGFPDGGEDAVLEAIEIVRLGIEESPTNDLGLATLRSAASARCDHAARNRGPSRIRPGDHA